MPVCKYFISIEMCALCLVCVTLQHVQFKHCTCAVKGLGVQNTWARGHAGQGRVGVGEGVLTILIGWE